MRKSLLLILVLLLTAVCACAAAETEFPLEAVSGKISFSEDQYVVLTPGNLSDHPDLLSSIGKTAEELQADWKERGVQLQAWSKDQKTCVEVSLVQDEASARYYDLVPLGNAERRNYYKEMLAEAKQKGYGISESENKLHKSGYYFVYVYHLKTDGADYRGIMRKTVRNGYTVSVDYQVFGRMPSRTDKEKSRKIINSVVIDTVAAPAAGAVSTEENPGSAADPAIPAGAANMLSVSVVPPRETNTGVFTVEGTAYPGSEVIVVAMRWSGSSYRFPTVAGTNGKYAAKVTLPDEGLYQITVNMCINNKSVADAVLDPVTYGKMLLPYSLDRDIPDVLTSDELILSGTTEKNVSIQCIVTRGTTDIPIKSIKTNGTGKFQFKIPTAVEGEYDITLVFSKKNLSTVRYNKKATRTFSAEDVNTRTASDAVRVNYNTLAKKTESYIGKTIVFDAYVTEVTQSGDEWMITAAQKLNRGTYSNYLVYMAKEDPGLTVGSRVKLYGICVGPHEIQSEEGTVSYPAFDYCFSK